MTFADLPKDWASRPVTDPAICHDLLDLVVFEDLRQRGGLTFLITNSHNRLVQPLQLEDVPAVMGRSDARQMLRRLLAPCAETLVDGGVLLAVARPHRLAATHGDDMLATVCAQVCDELGMRALGVFVVTPGGSLRVAGAEGVPDRAYAPRSA